MGGMGRIMIRAPWFFYLLVLVFLGGVIILIIYIRTFAANEPFRAPTSFRVLILIFIIIGASFTIINYNYRNKTSFNINIVINLYEYSNGSLSIFLITYLLITMICVVKLVKFEKGPLVGRLQK